MQPIARQPCYIEQWVEFGKGCIVHPFTYIGKFPSISSSLARHGHWVKSLSIGDETEIGPHSTIYSGVDIGHHCLIGDGAIIREESTICNRCIIGAHVCINYAVEIADDVRIQTGSFVTDGCKIGKGTFIGINVTMMSDNNPLDYKFAGSNPPIIGERCLIGSGSILMAGVHIGDDAVIGAGSLIASNIPAKATVIAQRARVMA